MVVEKNYSSQVNFGDHLCEIGIRQANIRRMIDRNFETFPWVFSFGKSRIKENGGKTNQYIKCFVNVI